MDQSVIEHVKGVVEALLFVNEKPVTLQQMKGVIDGVDANDIKSVIKMIQDEMEERKSGMLIVEVAGGYQMVSNSLYASYVRDFYKTKHKEKLSKPALETVAIVAYKQPVTRLEIEMIRGVNSDGVVAHLISKELIKIVGRKDVPGKPYLYGTTKQFQEYFGLKSLSDLPKLEDFPRLEEAMQGKIDEADARVPMDSNPADLEEAMAEVEEEEQLAAKENDGEAQPKQQNEDASDVLQEEQPPSQETNRIDEHIHETNLQNETDSENDSSVDKEEVAAPQDGGQGEDDESK
jgi:segregation and condensation protein B